MKTEIGTYEAKTRLAELLRHVKKTGKRFTITNRGAAVAELGPPSKRPKQDARTAIEAFQAYCKANPLHHKVDIRALIEEGRE
ncbi:MAG: type II toxin-antitoxin system prevent-host-death family antitoxin [Steroidobacteraceae bacterium]